MSIEKVAKLMKRNLETTPMQFRFCEETKNKLYEIYNYYIDRNDKRSLSILVEKSIDCYYKKFKESKNDREE